MFHTLINMMLYDCFIYTTSGWFDFKHQSHTNLFKENKFNELSIADRKDAGIYAAKKLEPPELPAKLPGEHWKQPEELLRAKTLLTRPAEHSCRKDEASDVGQQKTFQRWITGWFRANFDESAWHFHGIFPTKAHWSSISIFMFQDLTKNLDVLPVCSLYENRIRVSIRYHK